MITDQVPKTSVYTAEAGVSSFTYEFYVPNTSNVVVEVNGEIVYGGYEVQPASGNNGGNVVFSSGEIEPGDKVFIRRHTPVDQLVDLDLTSGLYPGVIEDALDKLTMIVQEIRGGTMSTVAEAESATRAGYAEEAGAAANAGYAEEAGALVAGATVSHAATAGVANALSSGVIVDSATNAQTASALISAERSSIIDEAVSSAGGSMTVAYNGPFALKTDGSGNQMTAGMNSGYVYAGGSQYLISGFDSDHTLFGDGETLYLTMLSSGGAISSGLVTSPSGMSSDTVIVRIASRMPDSDETDQLQFGDITTVPWGLNGGGGTVNAYVTEVSDTMYAPTAGVVFGQTYMDESQGAGQTAGIQVGASTYQYGKVPEHGTTTDFSSGAVGCMIMRPVAAGQLIAKTGSMNSAKVYFLGFGNNNQ